MDNVDIFFSIIQSGNNLTDIKLDNSFRDGSVGDNIIKQTSIGGLREDNELTFEDGG